MEKKAEGQACSYIIQSQEEEIKRIALELHEGISQNLYSLYTGLEFIQSGLNEPHIKSYAKELSNLMNRTIQEVRTLSSELYPTSLSTLGLTAAVKNYGKLFTSTFGIIIYIESIGKEKMISEKEGASLFRSCQEALINIAKYADVAEASICFNWEDEMLNIDIEDLGRGFNVQEVMGSNQFKGLAAIKQRMDMVGGECDLSSVKGKGTKVSLMLPIRG